MSDPLEERFRDFAAGTPAMSPAHPAEVRRRGDRLRRRRTGLAVAGTALAVALVATPIAVLVSQEDGGRREPAPAPSVTDPSVPEPTGTASVSDPVVAQVPPDFPLTAGYPPRNGNDGTPVETTARAAVTSLELCGASVWSPDDADALDVAGASYTGEAEDARARTLVLYTSAERAEANRQQIVDGVTACPSDGGADGSEWAVTEERDGTTVVTRQYVTGGLPNTGFEVYLVTRVGNALLVDLNYGEGGGSPESRELAVEFAAEQQADVVAAMGQFDLPSGAEIDPGFTPGELPVLAADDLPTRDRLTAWERVPYPDLPVIACQPGVRFSGQFLGHADFTARIAPQDGAPGGEDTAAEIRTAWHEYPTEDEAAAAADAVTGWLTDCDAPAQTNPDDLTRQGDVVQAPFGRYATWVYAAREVCTDCDAAWFDRMGVVRDGTRIAVVTFREVGGPLEPEGLDATMTDLLEVLRQALPSA